MAREAILYRARALLPMAWVGKPFRAVRGEGPCADVGDTISQRINVAVGAVGEGDLVGEPVVGDLAVARQEAEQRGDEFGVIGWGDLAVIGDLADVPQ